ncbi:MAG: PIG-L family deacetylase [Chloroflexi bacterium]|nr:PIG-L family deacetylase [Chloroflexota bacterium]
MKYIHIYLSPHLDDAILSCGGRIWQQIEAEERVLVVTVFADAPAPDTPLSPFAQELHTRWGHLADAVLKRREEDEAALTLLGAEAVHWPYVDCIYRQTPDDHFPYASEQSLWGLVHPAESGLVAELADRVAAYLSSWNDADALTPVLHVPLAIGHHVDHQIVRRVAFDALELMSRKYEVIYYEDYPYAQEPKAVQTALASKVEPHEIEWQPEFTFLTEKALDAKVAAIAHYHSQLGTFWASLTEMAAAIRAFAEQVGSGKFAERYWISTLR